MPSKVQVHMALISLQLDVRVQVYLMCPLRMRHLRGGRLLGMSVRGSQAPALLHRCLLLSPQSHFPRLRIVECPR